MNLVSDLPSGAASQMQLNSLMDRTVGSLANSPICVACTGVAQQQSWCLLHVAKMRPQTEVLRAVWPRGGGAGDSRKAGWCNRLCCQDVPSFRAKHKGKMSSVCLKCDALPQVTNRNDFPPPLLFLESDVIFQSPWGGSMRGQGHQLLDPALAGQLSGARTQNQ